MTKTIPVTLCFVALALPMASCSSNSSSDDKGGAVANLAPKAALDEVITTNLGKASALAGGGADLLDLTVTLTPEGMVSMHGNVGKGSQMGDFTATATSTTDTFTPSAGAQTAASQPATATLPISQVDAKQLAEQLTSARSSCPGNNDTQVSLFAQLQHKRSVRVSCVIKGDAGKETFKPVTTTLVDKPAEPVDISSIAGIQKATATAATLLGSQQLTEFKTTNDFMSRELEVSGIVPGTKAMDGSACENVTIGVVDPTQPTTQDIMSLTAVCSPRTDNGAGATPAQITDTPIFTKAVAMAKANLATDTVDVLVSGDQLQWNFSRLVGKEKKNIGTFSSTIR